MKTLTLTEVKSAASILLEGGLVAIPTETVYGLAAPVFSESSVEKIFRVKGRPSDNPLIVHVSSMEQIERVAEDIPYEFYHLAEVFFPGPLTVILKKKASVPPIVSAHLDTIGVRMPKHPLALQLIQEMDVPLAAPSANLSGKPSSTQASHVLNDFDGKIEAILDGGPCIEGLESTVLLLEPKPIILRPGSIEKERIETVLRKKVEYASHLADRPLSPGMKYRHYCPKAKVMLFNSENELANYLKSTSAKTKVIKDLTPETLYHSFRQADLENVEEIAILLDAAHKEHVALMNRLQRAAYFGE